jgi:hypothetical protein
MEMKGGRLFLGALVGLLMLNVLLVALVSPVDAAPRRPIPPPAAPRPKPPPPPPPPAPPPPVPAVPDEDMPLGCLMWEDAEALVFLEVEETAFVRLCAGFPRVTR